MKNHCAPRVLVKVSWLKLGTRQAESVTRQIYQCWLGVQVDTVSRISRQSSSSSPRALIFILPPCINLPPHRR